MEVRVEWGPFMSCCYLTIQDEIKSNRVLHLANESVGDTHFLAHKLQTLATLHGQTVPLEEARAALPAWHEIQWDTALRGSKVMGYELRGKGHGLDAWIKVKSGNMRNELDIAEADALLRAAFEIRRLFFPT